jgi:transcriptional regulator with XRE-family HTH domain
MKFKFIECHLFSEREDGMEFNEKIQELRKQKGLTQEELSERLFVSRTAVSKWESGRGYPNIESLKAIAKFFGVTIDALLSGDELLILAEEDTRQKESRVRDLVFGLLDCSAALFFFLPFFGQNAAGMIEEVSLLSLNAIAPYMKAVYFAAVIAMIAFGILTLALQNCRQAFWVKNKSKLSLGINASGAFLFIISSQPYAAAFLFIFLVIKVFMLVKWQ